MRYFVTALFLLANFQAGLAQKKINFGLLTGATVTSFTTTVDIGNAINLSIPPLNDFQPTSNFHVGFFFEKQFSTTFSLRWEVQRSPGGAKTYDAVEEREKRYKFFYLSSPIILKMAPFQKKVKHRVQLEAGFVPNLFLFDYGEDITFGEVKQLEYSSLVGISRPIDEKWTVSLRYLRGITSFSEYQGGDTSINWKNRFYTVSFSRTLFQLGKQ